MIALLYFGAGGVKAGMGMGIGMSMGMGMGMGMGMHSIVRWR